jgi:hypothetical protein
LRPSSSSRGVTTNRSDPFLNCYCPCIDIMSILNMPPRRALAAVPSFRHRSTVVTPGPRCQPVRSLAPSGAPFSC